VLRHGQEEGHRVPQGGVKQPTAGVGLRLLQPLLGSWTRRSLGIATHRASYTLKTFISTTAWYFRLGGSSGSVDLRAGTPAPPGARTGVFKLPWPSNPTPPPIPVDPAAVAGRASPTPLFPASTVSLGDWRSDSTTHTQPSAELLLDLTGPQQHGSQVEPLGEGP
jgi:hypothetical protein